MPAPRGGKKAGDRGTPRPVRPATRPGRPPRAGDPEVVAGFEPRPFRGPPPRLESTAGLRSELADLRAEVHRLAAEIDKLWARERGRSGVAPARTARSIAGKPVRTGTRASGARTRVAPAAGAGGARKPARGGSTAGPRPGAGAKRPTSAKRTQSTKRGAGWAKPKSTSRRKGTTPRRKGR